MGQLRTFVADHLTLSITAATTFVFVLEILSATHFHITTTVAVVGATDATTLLLAFVVAVLPSIAIGLIVLAVLRLAEAWAYHRPSYRRWRWVVAGLAVALIPFSSIASFTVIALGCAAFAYYFGRGHRRAHEGRGKPPWAPGEAPLVYIAFAFGLGVVILAALAILGVGSPWPAERLRLSSGDLVGYVVGTDGDWSAVLREHDRKLVYVRSDDIEGRLVCEVFAPQEWWRTRFPQILGRTYAPCPRDTAVVEGDT